MSEIWSGRSGFTKELSNKARATVRGDIVMIVTQDDENLDDGLRVMNFQRSEALSLATWILEHVSEVK